ncbi:PREDICTED: keratin-associated protein 5-5-like [Vollenhovia emeryi]|uniref:keratin-associated protein 5-5-like n=1 Tax=Vollenhovia emeryi TaxID=411798 RepID=UPI0005F46619|nr:PREDICTED: keratin-associated protein 5-5-like [Vollenhovia emeryi]
MADRKTAVSSKETSAPRNHLSVWRSSRDHGCCCGGLALNDSCAPSPDKVRIGCVVPSRSRCRCPRVCKKAVRCEPPPCTTDVRSCGGSGCCGGYGTPGQICAPSPRICNSPAHSSRGRSCCASRCAPQPPCSIGGCRGCCGGSNCGRLPREPPSHLEDMIYGCCIVDDGARCGVNEGCCALKLHLGPLKCLGGGRDCRRCGRKVYQAEMQTASGVPYHNSCFSCFCCRKPLEPLTYQENSGEIYCKQCYVRNFGPQGYGYGVLQTPL